MRTDEITSVVLRACKGAGATDAVIIVVEEESTQVRFSNNEVSVNNHLREASASVFVCVKEKKAGTNVVDMSKRTLEGTSRRVVEAAQRSPSGGAYAPLPSGPFIYDPSLTKSESTTQEPKELISWVRTAIDSARRQKAERVAGSLVSRNVKVTLRTSAGAQGVMERGGLEMSIRAFCGGNSSGHSVSVAGREKDFDPASAGAEAGRIAKLAIDPAEAKHGKMDAVFSPLVMADLIQQIGHMASAFHVDTGRSFLRDMLGEQIASTALTVSDDATDPRCFGAIAFDQEGRPTKKKHIIEDGILRNYLHNTTTASEAGVESTSNAGLVVPMPFNLSVREGTSSLDDLLSKIDHGIYVTNGWFLRYQNFGTGDLSFISRDALFEIENGEIKSPLKEARISDNMLRMLRSMEGLGRDRRCVKWWEVETPVLTPAALVRDVNFTESKD